MLRAIEEQEEHLPVLIRSSSLISPSLYRGEKSIVMMELQPAAKLHKSRRSLRVKGRERTPLVLPDGGTAFRPVLATEVNYGRPSILRTLKWRAGTGRKTLSICYIHQSSL